VTLKPAPDVPLADVEWRVDSEPKDNRARFVPHVNARIAARLLDEWVGPGAWSDEYRTVTIAGKEAILCTVSVLDGERWVSKQDVGVVPASGREAQKGAISDAFKRVVCVKWGAGRNVYELPSLWAPCKVVTREGKKPTAYPNERSQPALLAELKRLGFDGDAKVTVAEHDETDDEPAAAPAGNVDEMSPAECARALRDLGKDASGTPDEVRERLRAVYDELKAPF